MTSKKDQCIKWLAYYGFHGYVDIEEEAAETLLTALTQPDVVRVAIDKDGAIQIEYNDTDMGDI